MMKMLFVVAGLLLVTSTISQTINQKLQKTFTEFEKDFQLKHAVSSLYVIDAKTGKVIFDKNSLVGLAPASTQKIITSVTAFELLGKNYRYKTTLAYHGSIKDSVLAGCLYVLGSGDPTLGSWRYEGTTTSAILNKWTRAVKALKCRHIDGMVITNASDFSNKKIPDGWIWQDIGNYYGAGSLWLNWRENQYDIILSSGNKVGDPVEVVKIDPPYLVPHQFTNKLITAAKGTGDNAYIYFENGNLFLLEGTIPAGEKNFVISGNLNRSNLIRDLDDSLSKQGVGIEWPCNHPNVLDRDLDKVRNSLKILNVHQSPPLDSIIYWFNKKSINLYGEALVQTFAYETKRFGSTDTGVAIVKEFWKQKGLDKAELNIYDGSGLSPLNRVTTHAQVEILKYAQTRDWFPLFYNALPEYNGMKIKSGTINNVKGFCGYHKAKDGNEYIFSFLVNNYNGSASTLVNKMFKVLDIMK